jgi:hypothetical protein
MNNKNIYSFIGKIFVFGLPLLVLSVLYFFVDPFKVLGDYPVYYKSGYPQYIVLNRGFVSTTMFDKYYSRYNYNSFILGNSRSIFYEVNDWKPYLNGGQSCFHFDASDENIYGIYKKVLYLDSKVPRINNILLILDYSTLSDPGPHKEGHLFVIPPQLENNQNFLQFHLEFLKSFFNPKFLLGLIDLNLSGKISSFMENASLFDDRPVVYDLISNEIRFENFEKMIEEDDNLYYRSRMHLFYERTGKKEYSRIAIYDQQKRYLEEIKKIFNKHNTDYKIIINPLYDQIALNQNDLKYLRNIFGEENVFDFSGINEFTNDYKNYYETSHYRPNVACRIIRKIYQGSFSE